MKRLIEVALPLKEVSDNSAREKSIRHGHISTLHIWWARRPLAACRAVVFASLIPDPDDADCPESFRRKVNEVLNRGEFKPKHEDGSTVEDTPRNRCLEFIKHLVRWENTNNPEYIELGRKLIAAAHKLLNPESNSDVPTVLDPFAGGGAIPLSALRLGCEANAIDLNPVAHLVQLCTLVYPQQYGSKDSRPIPEYITQLIATNRDKNRARGEKDLFDDNEKAFTPKAGMPIPDVDITEGEYRKNPLKADVTYWSHWVLAKTKSEIAHLYPQEDGNSPVAFIWARTLPCSNPSCRTTIPLMRSMSLVKKRDRNIAITLSVDPNSKDVLLKLVHNPSAEDIEASTTVQRGSVRCPVCNNTENSEWTRECFRSGQSGHRLLAVVTPSSSGRGKQYRLPNSCDEEAYRVAVSIAHELKNQRSDNGQSVIPDELLATDEPRRMNVVLFGILKWRDLFNERQLVAIDCFRRNTVLASQLCGQLTNDANYGNAVASLLACILDRLIDKCSTLCFWNNLGEKLEHTFGRQALPMVWDYAEVNPFSEATGNWVTHIDWVLRCIEHNSFPSRPASVQRGDATRLPFADGELDAVITDPPYYDSVCYANLSDFFYVWLKRTLNLDMTGEFSTPLTPKGPEIIQNLKHKGANQKKDRAFYEQGMKKAIAEIRRVTGIHGIAAIMFAHTSTSAWEVLISAILGSGLYPSASWPIHTERAVGMVKKNKAMLASSITVVCRRRPDDATSGLWDDVRTELHESSRPRLDYFWSQGIRGADFFISAIGPALSVYGRYAKVIRLSGEEVSVGDFLNEVRSLVTSYALAKILHTTHTATIDSESRFYVIWKWSYGDAQLPADDSFKLAQALGMHSDVMWDKSGVLRKSGDKVQCVAIGDRIRVKNLGEPQSDGAPASLVDVLHRMCAFRDKDDNTGMADYLARSGQARNQSLWLVAQAVSEILADGDREKQLMQGLLNQKETLEEATREGRLF